MTVVTMAIEGRVSKVITTHVLMQQNVTEVLVTSEDDGSNEMQKRQTRTCGKNGNRISDVKNKIVII